MRRNSTNLFCLGLLVLTAAAVASDDPQAPQMSPEEQAAMAAMEKAMTPGPQHQWLASMAGSWEVTTTFWMQPGGPPQSSTGIAERSMILGGRVMMEKVTSTMMGMPFEGMGLTGFDNVAGHYLGTWQDNMGTGVMVSTGKCADQHCDFTAAYNDPISGKAKSYRMTSDYAGDHETFNMFDTGPDGKEFKSGELVYTRKK